MKHTFRNLIAIPLRIKHQHEGMSPNRTLIEFYIDYKVSH